MRLADKVVLIAGAGGKQATAVALVFAREGARVAMCGLDGAELGRLEARIRNSGGEAVSRASNLALPEECEAAVKFALDSFGRIDVLYNNTGIYLGGEKRAHDTEISDWKSVLDVNLQSQFLCARQTLYHMAQRRSGAIINVAAARAARLGGNVAYSASKAAVIGMTKKLAKEYAADNIRVNCICPTNIQESPDPMSAPMPPAGVQRDGTPEDVAYAALFLASDEAPWITGIELVVDGGAEVMA
jgi:NAD(P)-dependent dehydrogenase (short-subunit alcohol dehydrogenase family)